MVAENGRLEMKLSSKMLKIGHFRVVFCTLCQNESSCESIHMKMFFYYKFIFMQVKLIFKGFARGFVLAQSHKVTRKWPISNILLDSFISSLSFSATIVH